MICKIFILRNQNTSRSLSLEHVLLCPVAKHTITLVDQVSEQEFFSDSQIGEVLMYSYIRHDICQKKITVPDFPLHTGTVCTSFFRPEILHRKSA